MHKSQKKTLLFISLTALLLLIAFVFPASNKTFALSSVKANEPELCYQCHEKLKENLSDKYTHFLFKEGRCSSCHDPHVSDHKKLMKDEINSLCLNCHKKLANLLQGAKIHGALKRGLCTDCHFGHSGKNKSLLVKAENELCWDCHEKLTDQLSRPYVHPLFEQGSCSSCHDAHVSREENLLKDKPNTTCRKCHGPRCKAGEVSISTATEKLDCTLCHTGHSSQNKGLLGPYGHTIFLEKKCEQCHNPFAANREITTIMEGKSLCFSCHKKESPTHYIDKDVHVKDAKNPCIVCHNPHASEKKNLTRNESSLCLTCHENTERRTAIMEKSLKSVNCSPITDRKCFECHMIGCSSEQPLYYSGDTIAMCVRCHENQHKTSHPVGPQVIDPRNGQEITCITCHSMHSSGYNFMLILDGTKALCIQCHRVRT